MAKPVLLTRLVNRMSGGRVKYGWWTSAYQSLSAPIIIGGCGRSGTTLLRAMLNAHPNIHIGPETGLLCGHLDLDDLSVAMGTSRAELEADHRASACLGEFVERVMGKSLLRSGKRTWGEKSPSNVLSLSTIFRFFPQARFIHVIRDGRDAVCSLRTHPKYRWESGTRVETGVCNPWSACVARWVRDTSAGLKWRGDPRYAEVQYENLVSRTDDVLRDLLSWLDEPWDQAVLEYHKTHEERGSDVANPGVKAPIYRDALNRWKEQLPQEAVEEFGHEARALLVRLGYSKDDAWTRKPQMLEA